MSVGNVGGVSGVVDVSLGFRGGVVGDIACGIVNIGLSNGVDESSVKGVVDKGGMSVGNVGGGVGQSIPGGSKGSIWEAIDEGNNSNSSNNNKPATNNNYISNNSNSSNKGSNSSNNNITSSSNSINNISKNNNNTSIMFKYQIYNNMMNMIIYTCNISNSCKTNSTILFKLKCIKKSPKI